MENLDLAYIAGLMDGEGSIMLTRNWANERRGVHVSIASTTRELVEFVHAKLGGHIHSVKRYREHHKAQYRWQVTRNAAIDVLIRLEPFLREPEKKRRARLIIDQYKILTPRNGKYTDEMLARKIQFEKEFFENSTKVIL